MSNSKERTQSLLEELLERAKARSSELPFCEEYYEKHSPIACQAALSNPQKNYENAWGYPYDHNMITTVSEYINASPMPIGSHRYIAAQGPRRNTQEEFWDMVWNERVSLIVTVTNEREIWGTQEHFKFDRFWPEQEDLIHRDCKLSKVREEVVKSWNDGRRECLVAREIAMHRGNAVRSCTHLQMHNWPDNGVIQPDSLIELSKQVDHYKADGSIVVHCAAGIGRTGTVIAFHSLYHDLKAYLEGQSLCFDPLKRVEEMRQMRWGAIVAAPEQYQLVIDALKMTLESTK
jgi:protein tyrosine phosphatase